ncbi:MAG TPA: dTMP kinase [Armatimonadetes bacterium]|nr:dTMP kinase [Armatimonadota bacterium]
MSSYFITFEGPEGSGKSTQAALLADALRSIGLLTRLTREPGGDPVSEQIRKILLDSPDDSITNRAELFLYLAARAQHVENIIRPNLKKGAIVICARYIDSTVAYQGWGGGLSVDMIRTLNNAATGGLIPDITFLMDIDAETGLKRQQDWNRMERKGLDYHARVREGFLAEAKLYPERIKVLDAAQDIDFIHRQVLHYVAEKLKIAV